MLSKLIFITLLLKQGLCIYIFFAVIYYCIIYKIRLETHLEYENVNYPLTK